MAKIIVGLNSANRNVAVCSNCDNQIYAPSNNVIYHYCYNCGAKFDSPIGAKEIKEMCKKPVPDKEEWNDDWRNKLEHDYPSVYSRLQNCNNTKRDLLIIACYIFTYNHMFKTKEQCLDRAIQWLTDWNGQTELIPTNYEWYAKRVTINLFRTR